jgi:teichuronic acid biosynthesis glycosyltransferase TuaC
MKVLVLSTIYPRPSQTASGIFVHRQTRALADLGVECQVLQPIDWAPPAPMHLARAEWRRAASAMADTYSEYEGIPIHHPRVVFPIPSRYFPGDAWERMGNAVARYVARRRDLRSSDLLFAHFLCHEGYAGVVARRQLGIPLVAIARGDDVHAWPVRWPDRVDKLRAVFREADGLLACSAGLARDAAAWDADGLGRQIDVVYDGIDTEQFCPPPDAEAKRAYRAEVGLPAEGKFLLCVATPIAPKGWIDLLDAFARANAVSPGWTLVGVGVPRGSGDLDIASEARARGIGDCVRWLGTVPAASMARLYGAVDAFALPSHNEGLSCSVLEAMASGLPVVATDVGGHAEIVEAGLDGHLVDARDAEGLLRALLDVMQSAEARARLGAAARERALALGDYRRNAKRLVACFESVLASNGRPAVDYALS